MLKIGTVFSGIGAIEHAINRIGLDNEIVFACDNGDVDILSKQVDEDIIAFEKEIKSLNSIIKNIKSNDDEKNELYDKLNDCKDRLKVLKDDLNEVNIDLANDFESYKTFYEEVIQKEKSKSKIKLYDELYTKANTIDNCNQKNYLIKLALQMTKDYSKLSSKYKIIENLKEKSAQFNLKNIAKEMKSNSEFLSMLHERINTLRIKNDLAKINDYAEKKKYVDDLYKDKENQNQVKKSYMANYDITEDRFHWNVSFLDGTQYRDKIDLFVGGSPCQSFSLVGKQRGLEDTRGTLFYEYARLISEIRPKVFIYENVKAVLSNDNGRTWETMKKVFTDLDYTWDYKVLNARDYGIPQNRERLYVIGFRNDLKLEKKFEFPKAIELDKTMQDFYWTMYQEGIIYLKKA